MGEVWEDDPGCFSKKRGRGRPRKDYFETKNVGIFFRTNILHKTKLDSLCAKYGLSKAQMLEKLIDETADSTE